MKKFYYLLFLALLGCVNVDYTYDLSQVPAPNVEYKSFIFQNMKIDLQNERIVKPTRENGRSLLNSHILDNHKDTTNNTYFKLIIDPESSYNEDGSVQVKLRSEIRLYVDGREFEYIDSYETTGSAKNTDSPGKSFMESYTEAYEKLIDKINNDEKKHHKIGQDIKNQIKEIIGYLGISDFYVNASKFLYYPPMDYIIDKLDKNTIYFVCNINSNPYHKFGIYSGQNIDNGNLADYYPGESVLMSSKIFLQGRNDYIDDQKICAYIAYRGKFSYISVLGVEKTVPKFIVLPEKYNSFLAKFHPSF